MAHNRGTLEEKFWQKVVMIPFHECWEWTGFIARNGYGRFHDPDSKVRMDGAHRVSWKIHYGEIPKGEGTHGTCVMHRCDNRSCVRPDHLVLGSQKDNLRDAKAKGRHAHGERSGHARLTADDIRTIFALRAQGFLQREIGEKFGTNQGHISRILLGKEWGHVSQGD